MKRGDIGSGRIEKVFFPNKGLIQIEGGTVTVKNGIPGQKVQFRIQKKKQGKLEGQILKVLEPSDLEIRDRGCAVFPECGGCMYRTMSYSSQLEMKEEQMRELLGFQKSDERFEGIRPSPMDDGYRNKMEYTFGDSVKDGPLVLGLHQKNSNYNILPAETCRIVHEDFNKILHTVQDYCRRKGWTFYHKIGHAGLLRHLLIRRASRTGEILVDLITTSPSPDFMELSEILQELPLEGKLVGFLHTVNNSVADAVKDERTEILFGRDFFYEEILGLKFKITPFSFFQTNSLGAEVLYSIAREYIGSVKDKTVFDLYCGTGTIAQILAEKAKKVVGVEIVDEAVRAARENAIFNGLENCTFLTGDVLKVLDTLIEKPDMIVLDPPREGVHPKALPKIIAYGVPEIVYISCKPTSLKRDLEIFQKSGYELKRAAAVDMFANTVNIETVCLLRNRKADTKIRIDV